MKIWYDWYDNQSEYQCYINMLINDHTNADKLLVSGDECSF